MEKSIPIPSAETPGGSGAAAVQLKRVPGGLQGKRGQRRNGIDAAGAEQQKAGLVRLAILQHVHQACQVVLEELPAAAVALHAGQHAGVGGGVDHPIGGRQDCRSRWPRGCRRGRTSTPSFRRPRAIDLRTGAHAGCRCRRSARPSRRSQQRLRRSSCRRSRRLPVIRTFIKRDLWRQPAASSCRQSPQKICVQRLGDVPGRIMRFHLAQIAVIADVVADAVLIHVAPLHRLAGDVLGHSGTLPESSRSSLCRRPGCRPRRRAALSRTRT